MHARASCFLFLRFAKAISLDERGREGRCVEEMVSAKANFNTAELEESASFVAKLFLTAVPHKVFFLYYDMCSCMV